MNSKEVGIIKNLLAIFDSDEMQTTHTMAGIHGYQVDPGTSIRNGNWIKEARDYVAEFDGNDDDKESDDGE